MSENVSRRDFLKLAGVGGTVATVLTGCGPASRYVVREPYAKMPEYTYNGLSTYYATTCRECAAACGLVVRTHQGRAIKIEGNKNNPVNLGKTCSRAQTTHEGLYNPDRFENPAKHSRGAGEYSPITWEDAISVVTNALKTNKATETAFLMGLAPDHLFDLVSDLTSGLGAPAPIRFGALGMFESRATLMKASESILGANALPFFDLANADVTFSFGANFLETWLSPVAYARGFSKMRQGKPGQRGYFVHFEARLSQTAMSADEWIPVRPGTEGFVALALGRLIAEHKGVLPEAYKDIDPVVLAAYSGVDIGKLEHLAEIFGGAAHPLAVPGGAALGQTNGLEAAEAILSLNNLVANVGQPGGVFFGSSSNVYETEYHRPASIKELEALVKDMNDGKIKTLFVHGVNPVFEMPEALGFAEALKNVPQVISFSSFPDETSMQADYVFPDHTGLESWGYQRAWVGTDRAVLSGAQPVVSPFYNTKATADVLLAAVAVIGGAVASKLPFADEVAFIENALSGLLASDGFYSAPEMKTFMAQFQQFGGWWQKDAALVSPTATEKVIKMPEPTFGGEGEFFLHVFPSPILGDGAGANRPWLQETPDPNTTVVWNTWVEMNPETAHELGIANDDVVRIVTEAGEVEASVYLYPAIRPDTIAIPFGQGHTAFGRYATPEGKARGVNPMDLVGLHYNASGDLAFGAMKAKVEKTGTVRVLARLEGRMGVYGDGLTK